MKYNNFILIVLFPVILLVFIVIFNIYSIGTNNSIKKEIQNYNNRINNYVEKEIVTGLMHIVDNENISKESLDYLNNVTRAKIQDELKLNFNSFQKSIINILNNTTLNITHIALFLSVLMFIWVLFICFFKDLIRRKKPSKNHQYEVYSKKNVENNETQDTESDKIIVKEEIVNVDNILQQMEENTKKSEIIVQVDDNDKKILDMYNLLVETIKKSNDKNALEILNNILKLDDKNYLALNGAGILYANMYSKKNENIYFNKADKYYETAISMYNKKDTLNNKAILYSTRYGIEKKEEYYKVALDLLNKIVFSGKPDSDFINNKAAILTERYILTGNNDLFESALSNYNEILTLNDENIYALNNRSALYFNKYKKTQDKELFEKSIVDCNKAFSLNNEEQLLSKNKNKPIYIYKY